MHQRLFFHYYLVLVLSFLPAFGHTESIPDSKFEKPTNNQLAKPILKEKEDSLRFDCVEFIPSIQDTIIIKDWLTIGPFSAGVREPGISYLPDDEDFVPYEGLKHRDILTESGELTWHKVKSEDGKVKIKGDSVNYDFIQDLYGSAGLFGVSFAYGEFENEGEKRALVIAEGCNFRLNGKGFIGDPYSTGYVRIPVVLKNGKNKVLVSVSGFGEREFIFKIIPAPKPMIIITNDATTPDIIYGDTLNSWLGVPLLNTAPKTITDVSLTFGDNKFVALTKLSVKRVAPLTVKKVKVGVKTVQPINESIPGDTIAIPIVLHYGNYTDSAFIKLRLRRPNQSRKETFLSEIDSSVQYYAVLPPAPPNHSKSEIQGRYALILTLHGAGVDACSQVDSYSQKDWAYVVAPTNRRPFGFDWQDWGRLDALECLKHITLKGKAAVDENRIYLTGHSMGGHGVWHIGLIHSDLFAAIAPSAGWTSFPIYIPWSLQKSAFFGHPDLLGIREKVLREDNPLNFIENGRHLPIYILQGSADDNVPPIHARLFAKYLKADAKFRKAEFIYQEVPNMGHWWDNDTFPGTACVDNPPLMEFLKKQIRNPYPKEIHFKTTNLSQNNKHFWVTLTRLKDLYQDAVIDAKIEDRTITVQCSNLAEFKIHLSEKLIPRGKIAIIINNQKLFWKHPPVSSKQDEYCITLRNSSGAWRIASDSKHHQKQPDLYGPIKQAYFKPFILVYGTKGDSAMTELLQHQARIQALTWWIRANGTVEILPDTEVTQSIINNYNLIIFGNSRTNVLTQHLEPKLPIRVIENAVLLHKLGRIDRIEGDFGVIFIYPNPLNPKKLILIYEGTNEKGQKLSDRFGVFYSGAGLPDFLIISDEVKQKGWGGIKAGGFFSNQWQLE
ncbi:MAG: prolyl oligopeptidase family serine peptidase [candidate division WOR-3 bacterium]